VLKVKENDWFVLRMPLSHTPVSEVDVWGAVSKFVQRTVAPWQTVMGVGSKAKLRIATSTVPDRHVSDVAVAVAVGVAVPTAPVAVGVAVIGVPVAVGVVVTAALCRMRKTAPIAGPGASAPKSRTYIALPLGLNFTSIGC